MSTPIVKLATFAAMTPDAGLRGALQRSARPHREISASGIKGRGGAGFPVGVKWNLCAAAGREQVRRVQRRRGEPGTFRTGDPERARRPRLRGHDIAASAVGAREGSST